MSSPPLHKSGTASDLEYFEDAVDFLTSQPTAIPDRCGVVANCMSGAYGVLMGAYIEKVKAVFLLNGAYILPFLDIYRGGKLLMKSYPLGSADLVYDENSYANTNTERMRSVMNEPTETRVPIEKSSKDTFYCINYGDEDTFSAQLSAECHKTWLDKVGHTNYELVAWKGSGHIIEPPNFPFGDVLLQAYWPNCQVNHRGPGPNKVFFAAGGNAKDTARNQFDIWQNIINFSNYQVRSKSPWYQSYLELTRDEPSSEVVALKKKGNLNDKYTDESINNSTH